MLKCPKCGSELDYGMQECDFCFRKLTPRELTELERRHFQTDYATKNAKEFQRKKTAKKWLIILACIASVIIISAVVCRVAFKKSIITVVKDGVSSLYQTFFMQTEEETEEEKFLRLKDYAEQLCEENKDADYSKSLYKDFDEYILYLLEIDLETVFPGEFTDTEIGIETHNGKITEFSWNGWVYVYYNGYSKVIPPASD